VKDPKHHNEPASPYEWDGTNIAVATRDSGGYVYRPNQVLVRGAGAAAFVRSVTGNAAKPRTLGDAIRDRLDVDELPREFAGAAILEEWQLIDQVGDVIGVVNAATSAGFAVRPNHVLFADNAGCGCPCPPHPALANDLDGLVGNPLKANPLKANPLKANPLKANPLKANPLKANSLAEYKPPVSSAFPAAAPMMAAVSLPAITPGPRVVIFDSGLAAGPHRPSALAGAAVEFEEADEPDTVTAAGDGYLDPVAGHGTFIAGIVEQHCPGTSLACHKVLGPLGDVDEAALTFALWVRLVSDYLAGNAGTWSSTIFNISIGGYLRTDDGLLAETLGLIHALGIVVVASAGNLGDCRPAYPAAFPTVIGVGALGPTGPAEFSNYGPWVDACAPGTDLESAFFRGFNGNNDPVNGVDIDDFDGWAVWSGTSFAAPMVVAALIREMRIRDLNGRQAVEHLIDGPGRTRIPNLGTVVIA
jgi:hypothetical protein